MSTMRRRYAALLWIAAAAGCGQKDVVETSTDTPRVAPESAKTERAAAQPAHVAARAVAPVARAKAAPADECGGANCSDGPAPKGEDRVAIDIGSSPTRGPASAPVTIVVFTDFECPYCAKLEKRLAEISSSYGDSVRIAFKNRPLPMHEAARPAALAALAAAEQGKFWEYKTALFSHQAELDRESLENYAKDLGLDVRRFRGALDTGRLNRVLDDDIALAEDLDVKGTPTLFVNGRRVTGAQPFETFAKLIDEELAR